MSGMAKTSTLLALAAMGLLVGSPALADEASGHFYGPAPEWDEFRLMAEANIASQLIDPESARFTWMGAYHKGELKVILGARTAGYVGCGTVNAKNRMGGYVGAKTFAVVIDYGRVLYSTLGPVDYECSQLQAAGKFPPLPAAGSTAATPASNAAGLALRPMPEGAYVSAVSDRSAAAAAGLKPGMVITSVNAIPLAGMDAGMLKVIEAAGASATLTVVGGTTIKLGAKP